MTPLVRRCAAFAFAFAIPVMPCWSSEPTFPRSAKRILFLGDSNTFAGYYVAVVEATLIVNGDSPEIINLGLSSETCSGLSEPDHPFPRPNVHERIDRALAKIHPDVVVACYGMNDGIYHPPSGQRLEAYQRGINELIDKVHASGAKLILLTPPPFDAGPLRSTDGLVSIESSEFGWRKIYENYDDVMKEYSSWILSQRDRVEMAIDLRGPLNMYVDSQRAFDPKFSLSSDGVHVNHEGHVIIADAILDAWGLSERDTADDEFVKKIAAKQSIMKLAWLSEVGHQRPGVPPGLSIEDAKRKTTELK